MKKIFGLLAIALFVLPNLNAQAFDEDMGCIADGDDCVPNTILSAVPYLRITPDAIAGAMGDVGIATAVDPNAMHFNASKLAFAEKDAAISLTYSPWLRELIPDLYLAYASGYKRIDDLETVGFDLRFFSLGEINFTNEDGDPAGMGKPREIEVAFAYARKLTDSFSAGLTGKYIYSNLADGASVGGREITAANAFAADISMTYVKPLQISDMESELRIGMALTNIGSKVTYQQSNVKDFLPMNFGLGGGLTIDIDEFNSIGFSLEFNKLLVPTPVSSRIIRSGEDEAVDNPDYDTDGNQIADYREKSLFAAMLGSFGDAQGGFKEEMQEINLGFGFEYWYDKQFAVRAGYFNEHRYKGDRQFMTIGLGLKYNIFGLNLSYLVPTNNQRSPLDNTLRFTLEFDLGAN